MENEKRSIVLYSDGGCMQTTGVAGWGVHGYLYNTDVPKQGSGCPNAILTAKGYCTKENNKGIAMPPVTVLGYVDIFGSIVKNATNNVAEMTAMLEAMNYILRSNIKKALIYSDSDYVIKGLNEWSDTWIKNDWKKRDGLEVANKTLWIALVTTKQEIDNRGIYLELEWVKGHDGEIGNETADELATFGIIVGKKNLELIDIKETDAKGYWNKTFDHNRFIDKPRWYFNSHNKQIFDIETIKTKDGRWIYYLGNHGPDDELFGKPMSDAAYSVVFLKEPIKELELARSFQNSLNIKDYTNLIIGRLDKLLSGRIMELISTYSDLLFESEYKKRNILLNKTLLTKEQNPAQLAYRGIEQINNMENILKEYIEDPSKYNLSVTEITDIFYSTELKGKVEINKLKSTINSSTKKITVKCKYDTLVNKGEVDVPLLLGIDTPSRNALSVLAESNPKVFVVTWKESDIAFHYATVIETADDIGMWAGVYSNLRLLTS